GVKIVARQVQAPQMDNLRVAADAIKNRMPSGVIVLASAHEGKVNLVCMVSDDFVARGLHAGNIIKEIAKVVGGSGGGKPAMAQAGGKYPAEIGRALSLASSLVSAQLKL
ncbi:MAG: DHHA1 domain-containing protein, partial [bacterium]|nr:DHHA1 domain-containing protein [bacterium]